MTGLTAKQMVYEAKIFYEDIASNNAPSFTNREWSVILTNAQYQLVQQAYKTGYDNNEENRLTVQNLFVPFDKTEFTNSNIITEAKLFDYPDNLMYVAYENCIIDYNGKDHNAKVFSMTYDAYHTNINNPFKKPSKDKVWRVVGYDNLNLLVSLHPIKKYKAVYISRPEPIIIEQLPEDKAIESGKYKRADCKLHPNTHKKIAQIAAKIAYASTQEQLGYQIQDAETQRI